jgi:DNA-directed RNA polymerase alpha subunit
MDKEDVLQLNMNLIQLTVDLKNLEREMIFLKKEIKAIKSDAKEVIDNENTWKAEYAAKFEDLDHEEASFVEEDGASW